MTRASCLPLAAPGHGDDWKPVPALAKRLCGQRFGDRGSLPQVLHDPLVAHGRAVLTNIRTNRKNRLRPLWDQVLLRTRARIDTLNDPWQHLSPMEHTQPRRVTGCMVNLVAGLVA
jgi:Transposase DDE domain